MLVCPQCGSTGSSTATCPRDGSSLIERGHDTLLGSAIGNYRLARRVGEGAMGCVYLGVNPNIGSRVAIKVISSAEQHDSSVVERFFAEARIVNVIRHENIVNVLDLGWLDDGQPYIVMEYVDGVTLSELISQPGGLSARELIDIGLQILEALAAAHAKGIVHRDLKPDNVMVTPEGRAKVLDFGIAKLRREGETSHGLTAVGALLGTPNYMSPEQALARPVDPRSDLYSFGVILYKGLMGRVPFTANSMYAVLQHHVSTPPPPLRSERPDLPLRLEHIVLKALAKDPNQRPQSAKQLAAELLEAKSELPGGSKNAFADPLATDEPPFLPESLAPSRPDSFAAYDGSHARESERARYAQAGLRPDSTRDSEVPSGSSAAVYAVRARNSVPSPQRLIMRQTTSSAPAPQPSTNWLAAGTLAVLVIGAFGLMLAMVALFWWQRALSKPAARVAESRPASTLTPNAGTPTPGSTSEVERQPASNLPSPSPQIANSAQVGIGNGSILQGQYSTNTLNSELSNALTEVRACYVASLRESPQAQGTLDMQLQISPEGAPRNVGAGASTLPAPLIGCVSRAILALTFPAPANGQFVNATFQITLRTSG